jgi:phage baseplate assembly protein W
MATIDLNNLIRPKKVNNTTTTPTLQVNNINPVYVDLHLDLTLENTIGLGNNPVQSRDILVDTDIQAIKNSIRNIFTTKKGQKLLSPDFGCSLEQYLFEKVSEFGGNIIGNAIHDAIVQYEPRVDIVKIYVETQPYKTKDLKFSGKNLTSYTNSKVDMQLGPGYAITVIYKFKEIQKQDILSIFAEMGGQILI